MNDLERVKKNPFYIQYMENPSLEIQLEAVKQHEYTIVYIKNPSIEVQIESIKKNAILIQLFKNPSKELCKIAILSGAEEIDFPWETMTEEVAQYVRDCLIVKDIME